MGEDVIAQGIREDDLIAHPSHYNRGGIEVMDIQKAYGVDPENYWRGNAIKYLLRAPFKGAKVRDYHKCMQSIQYLLDVLEGDDGES